MIVGESGPVVGVVDDDPRVLESMEDLLESANFSVRCFASAASLLATGVTDIDVLITDIGMPGMDGFELREAVKRLRPELPVILITGRDELVAHGTARAIGPIFQKPFDSQALLAAVGKALHIGRGSSEAGSTEPA
jgi:FixJ family two-component response regulator